MAVLACRLITTMAGMHRIRNHERIRIALSSEIALVVRVRNWDLKLSLPVSLLGSEGATPNQMLHTTYDKFSGHLHQALVV